MAGEIQADAAARRTIIHKVKRLGDPKACGSPKPGQPVTLDWTYTTCPDCVAKAPPGTKTSTP
jgi:hypothetical protein